MKILLSILNLALLGLVIAGSVNAQTSESGALFLIDTSHSMSENNKLENIKTSLLDLEITLSSQEYLGITAFSETPFVPVELSKKDIPHFIRSISNLFPTHPSILVPALKSASAQFHKISAKDKKLIILTDGEVRDSNFDIVERVKELKDAHVSTSVIQVSTNSTDTRMQEITNVGGGNYSIATTTDQIKSQIRKILNTDSTENLFNFPNRCVKWHSTVLIKKEGSVVVPEQHDKTEIFNKAENLSLCFEVPNTFTFQSSSNVDQPGTLINHQGKIVVIQIRDSATGAPWKHSTWFSQSIIRSVQRQFYCFSNTKEHFNGDAPLTITSSSPFESPSLFLCPPNAELF